MARIQKLTDELANQIAAGEVVERPSSVVKELVENSLDAGATRVAIDIELGGTVLVRVVDDGEGMNREDALLCLERHATSKIRRLEDLSALHTFGFRGEALPSIASVSRMTLRTRLRGTNEAIEVKEGALGPAGGAEGTSIEVRDLFYNVPARRKFLKATATESAHVSDTVLGVALSRPDVTFVLSRDGRVVRELLRASSRGERARAALGAEKLHEVTGERGTTRIEGMLGAPERARAGATGLSLLVNGRPVRDRFFARAVAQAYGSVLEPGRYPVGVVWLDLPPDAVDVNVHPQKAEVRFADSRMIFDVITRELHTALARAFGLPTLGSPYQHWARPIDVPTLKTLAETAAIATQMPAVAEIPQGNLFPSSTPISNGPTSVRYGRLQFVGQVHGTYLLCEGDDALYVIDQHAAAERVMFDRLKRSFEGRAIGMQRLLVPEIVELGPSEVALLEERREEVAALGVEVRAVGDASVAVHGVPKILARAEPSVLVRDLVAELGRAAGRPFGGAVDLVLATMACHGSIRAGDAISREEATALLAALDTVDFAGHCPHGRPLVMRLAWGDLERRVGR